MQQFVKKQKLHKNNVINCDLFQYNHVFLGGGY